MAFPEDPNPKFETGISIPSYYLDVMGYYYIILNKSQEEYLDATSTDNMIKIGAICQSNIVKAIPYLTADPRGFSEGMRAEFTYLGSWFSDEIRTTADGTPSGDYEKAIESDNFENLFENDKFVAELEEFLGVEFREMGNELI